VKSVASLTSDGDEVEATDTVDRRDPAEVGSEDALSREGSDGFRTTASAPEPLRWAVATGAGAFSEARRSLG
jgi:hypothetical protein